MNKSLIVLTILLLTQTYLAEAGGSGFGFDVKRSAAYLNAGNCYLVPGISSSSSQGLGYQYYGLPYGWKQTNNYLYIPNLLSQKGDWTFGLRATQGNSSPINQLFKVTIDGLQLKLSPLTLGSSINLVIGPNFRSQGVSESDYKDFLKVTSSPSPSSSSTGTAFNFSFPSLTTGSSAYQTGNGFIDNLISTITPRFDNDWSNILQFTLSTPSSTIVSGGPTAEQRKSALDRQFNANQALNSLTTLINQLTANVQSSTNSISNIQKQIDNYRANNNQCNEKLLGYNTAKLTYQTKVNDIQEVLDQGRQKLGELNPSLDALTRGRDDLVAQRASIQRNKPSASSLIELESNYITCNTQVESDKKTYSVLESNIQVNTDKINKLKNDAADAPNQINLINNQLSVLDQTIADLQAKLADANSQKTKLVNDRANYNSIVANSNYEIANIQRDISSASSQLPSLQTSIDTKIFQCSNLKTQSDDIRTKIATSQADYDQLNQQIDVQDGLISNKRSEIQRYSSQINSYPSSLSVAQSDLKNAQDSLDRQYYICNQFSTSVSNAESDLNAANLKLETQRKFLSDAQSKLAAAQAEKKAADDAVNKLLSQPTTTTTTTTTVNVSSSPLFPSLTGGISGIFGGISRPSTGTTGSSATVNIAPFANYVAGPTSVGLLNNYLDRVYGSKVRQQHRPSRSASRESSGTMYPLNPITINALTGTSSAGVFLPSRSGSYLSGITAKQIGTSSLPSTIIGNFGCSSTGSGLISGYGKITSIQPGYITVRGNNNDSYNLRIGSCSRLQASRPSFVASVLDPVFFRGYKANNNEVQLYDLTCVQ